MCGMTHTVREKTELLARVRRIRGKVEAIGRALDGEAGGDQVLHLIVGCAGYGRAEVVEDHVRTHLVNADKHPGALNTAATEQLLEVVRTYLK
jgi:FrmR/RcnR family transcriptional regulator, repressor of frmRAB operon